jgi:hypothetical protein
VIEGSRRIGMWLKEKGEARMEDARGRLVAKMMC